MSRCNDCFASTLSEASPIFLPLILKRESRIGRRKPRHRWAERERWKEGEKRCSPYIYPTRDTGTLKKSWNSFVHASQFLSIRQSIGGYRYEKEEKGKKNAEEILLVKTICKFTSVRTNIEFLWKFFFLFEREAQNLFYSLFSHLCRDIFFKRIHRVFYLLCRLEFYHRENIVSKIPGIESIFLFKYSPNVPI